MTLRLLFKLGTAASLLLAAVSASARVTLPEQLGDYCILQQQTSANLWGRAAANSKVTVKPSWSKTSYSVTADARGRWLIAVDTPKASYDPQTITISDKDGSVTLHDVLIGEVWLAGGQSNMEMPLIGFNSCPVEGAAETILRAGEWKGKVRSVKIPKTGNPEPQEFVEGKWVETSPITAKDISATAWYFATALNAALDVPVGIVSCNWGGSSVESWLPKEVVHSYPPSTIPDGSCEPVITEGGWYHYTSPYVMYNAMIHPVSHYTIKGFIWYQGETNAGLPQYYPERLATMVKIWRELWGDPELPFYEVELAPWLYGGDGTSGARIREAQRKAAQIIPHSGIICTNDLAYPFEKDQIHPCQKRQVGERLALLALNRSYGMEALAYEGPVYKDIEISGDTVIVNFTNTAYDGLSPWHDIVGFELAGEDRVFYPARAERKDYSVVVTCEQVPSPVAVRYCFRDFQVGNLTGSMNLPAFPFRSDDW